MEKICLIDKLLFYYIFNIIENITNEKENTHLFLKQKDMCIIFWNIVRLLKLYIKQIYNFILKISNHYFIKFLN